MKWRNCDVMNSDHRITFMFSTFVEMLFTTHLLANISKQYGWDFDVNKNVQMTFQKTLRLEVGTVYTFKKFFSTRK